jgi:hypothetical protein
VHVPRARYAPHNDTLGEEVPERNRELFVVQKVDGEWKLARYLYNKTE